MAVAAELARGMLIVDSMSLPSNRRVAAGELKGILPSLPVDLSRRVNLSADFSPISAEQQAQFYFLRRILLQFRSHTPGINGDPISRNWNVRQMPHSVPQGIEIENMQLTVLKNGIRVLEKRVGFEISFSEQERQFALRISCGAEQYLSCDLGNERIGKTSMDNMYQEEFVLVEAVLDHAQALLNPPARQLPFEPFRVVK